MAVLEKCAVWVVWEVLTCTRFCTGQSIQHQQISPAFIIRSQPWVAELVKAAGGEFTGPPGVQTTAEEVLRAAPDVLVAAWCGAGDRVPLHKTILQRGGWQDLPASKSGRVFCISDELLNTPAPTLVQGLQALA